MSNLPQELVDLVIDKLAESLPFRSREPRYLISYYSTVSQQWVQRTQLHHFKVLRFAHQDHLHRWRKNFTSGFSRYVHELQLRSVDTLEGFCDYFRDFTEVKVAEVHYCNFFRSLEDVWPLTSLGSTLVDLEITMDPKAPPLAPEVIARFLAALPHLRHFHVQNLFTTPPQNPDASLPRIPFFEGENDFELLFDEGYPDVLWWVPPTARFGKLALGVSCLVNVDVVNKWITSSGPSLKWLDLSYDGDLEVDSFDDSPPLDLSGCTSLETLEFPVTFSRPGYAADLVLPSICSSKLSTVILDVSADAGQVETQGWETLERGLCRLATLGGGKMVVRIGVYKRPNLLEEYPMPELEKEARIKVFLTSDQLCD